MAFALAALLCGCGGSDSPTPNDGTDAPPTTPGSSGSEAVAFQSDASHSGIANASTPSFPLTPGWQRTFASAVSYPLIAGGKVFVIVSAPSFVGPAQLIAIDQATGLDAWPAISLGSASTAAHAYEQGRIFVIGTDGILRAFDAATGALVWSTLLSSSQGTPPVARDGKIYVTSSSGVYAVDGRSGAILWFASVYSQGIPSLSTTGVLFTSSCDAFSLLQSTGVEQWRVGAAQPCTGTLSGTVAYGAGRAYLRGYDFAAQKMTLVARDAQTGSLTGSANAFGFLTMPIPAVSVDAVYVLNAGTLQRFDPSLQTVSWSFAGDGSLTSAPLVIGSVVLVGGSNGKLYALDSASGSERWSTLVPAAIEAPNDAGFSVTSGMAAANGILVVPAGRTLNSWRLNPS